MVLAITALGIVGVAVGVGVSILIVNFREMRKNPGSHPWPAVTRCRLCEQRVYIWQKHERRAYNVDFNNPDRIAAAVSSSGIVHKSCQGTPSIKIGLAFARNTEETSC